MLPVCIGSYLRHSPVLRYELSTLNASHPDMWARTWRSAVCFGSQNWPAGRTVRDTLTYVTYWKTVSCTAVEDDSPLTWSHPHSSESVAEGRNSCIKPRDNENSKSRTSRFTNFETMLYQSLVCVIVSEIWWPIKLIVACHRLRHNAALQGAPNLFGNEISLGWKYAGGRHGGEGFSKIIWQSKANGIYFHTKTATRTVSTV